MKNENTTIALCGLGYVGLPVAMLFADTGFKVIGVDVDEKRVEDLNSGINPIKGKEPGMNSLINDVHESGNFEATTDVKKYKDADFIIVAVQTPVESVSRIPKYVNLRAALKDIGKNLKKDAVVIIESTIAPGTIEKVVKPILEKETGWKVGEDFHIANCPERLMPGRLLRNIKEYNRVVGGYTPEAAKRVKNLYSNVVKGRLDETDCITAEIVKVGENAYRDVQIAFANEMALLCEAMGANVWEVRELINECRRVGQTPLDAMRQMHFPGSGVGGHCIPKDSWLLVHGAEGKVEAKIIPNARDVNDFMPNHMFELLESAAKDAKKDLKDVKVLVLGYAYAGNSDDDRNSPAEDLRQILDKEGIDYEIHDSYIKEYRGPLMAMIKDKDAIVLMADHDEYTTLVLDELLESMKPENPIIVDGRNVFNKTQCQKRGFVYKGVGNV